MLCQLGCGREKTRVKWCKYVCDYCEPKPIFNFLPIETENFKHYHTNGGNVSKARVENFKRRRINRDYSSKGEVVMADKLGRITDKRATL